MTVSPFPHSGRVCRGRQTGYVSCWEDYPMQRSFLPAVVVMVAMFLTAFAVSGSKRSEVDRGSYIVNRVAMCGNCHTPMLSYHTPAGFLRGWSDGQVTKFLMIGATPSVFRANPPMPHYRLDENDAVAVTAYLRSLPPVKQL